MRRDRAVQWSAVARRHHPWEQISAGTVHRTGKAEPGILRLPSFHLAASARRSAGDALLIPDCSAWGA